MGEKRRPGRRKKIFVLVGCFSFFPLSSFRVSFLEKNWFIIKTEKKSYRGFSVQQTRRSTANSNKLAIFVGADSVRFDWSRSVFNTL